MRSRLSLALAGAAIFAACDGPGPTETATEAASESEQVGAIVADLSREVDCPAPYACKSEWDEGYDAFGRVTAMNTDWTRGDVFAAVSQGEYFVYDPAGVFKEMIANSTGGFTTGCAFDRPVEKLYTTDFSGGRLVVYDEDSPHTVLQTITTGPLPESIVFDSNGDFYVGTVGGLRDVEKYDASGNFITRYDVATEAVGADWIELAADETTLFYTSEGTRVFRYDLSTSTQLPDFATVAQTMFALRLLPPGDGSGGLLVAASQNVLRLDGSGNVVATYDVTGADLFFALNLDPDGTSFWSGDINTGQFFKFDINTPGMDNHLLTVSTGRGGGLFGLCVQGELTGGNQPPTATINSPTDGSTFTLGQSISFDGEGDDPEDGMLSGASLQWESDVDGSIGSGTSFSFSGLSLGTHVITLTVTDSDGALNSTSVTIDVEMGQGNTPPTATINAPMDGDMFMQGQSIAFDGEADDAEDGALADASLTWESNLDGAIGTGNAFSTVLSVGAHTITLTATDSDGATGTASVDITVKAPSTGKDLVNQLEDIWYTLRDLNQSGDLDDAQFTALEQPIRLAIKAAIADPLDRIGVIRALEDFAREVRALGSQGVLDGATVQILLDLTRTALRSLP